MSFCHTILDRLSERLENPYRIGYMYRFILDPTDPGSSKIFVTITNWNAPILKVPRSVSDKF